MNSFTYALEQRNLEELRKYPKADLHNHFVLGGNRMFIYQKTRKKIEPLVNPLSSMDEMNQWSQKYIDQDFNSTAMRKFLIRATFEQAKEDGVTVLEIGEDVWGLNEFFNNDIDFCFLKDTDVVRHELVKKIINAYDKYYEKNPPKEE